MDEEVDNIRSLESIEIRTIQALVFLPNSKGEDKTEQGVFIEVDPLLAVDSSIDPT